MILSILLRLFKHISARQAMLGLKAGWPSRSPDLNATENLWWELNIRLVAKKPHPFRKEELFSLLKQEWNQLPKDTLHVLVHSMSHRIQEVIEAKGGPTSYQLFESGMTCIHSSKIPENYLKSL
jgi:hypothetical protein